MPRPPAAGSRRAPPAPPPQTFNECLACGEPATLRCAACLQKGSIELFFCSKEHQKLIWPVHRMFCGERARPIRMPPFSQEEADTIRGLLAGASQRADPDAGRNLVNTLLDREYTHRVPLKDEQKAEAMVLNFVGKDCSFAYDSRSRASDPDGERINMLRMLRFTLFMVPLGEVGRAACKQQMQDHQDDFEPLSQCLMLYTSTGSSNAVDPTQLWHSRFCHSLFAQAILRDLVDPGLPRAEVDSADMIRFRRKGLQVLQTYLRTTQTAANRAFAKDALRKVTDWLAEAD